MLFDSLDHLCGHIGIYIVFGQFCADGVDGLLTGRSIKLDIIELRTWRKRTNAEPLDTRRRCAGELQDSIGIDVVSATVNKKSYLVVIAVHNRGNCEPPSLTAERSQSLRTVLRVVFLHISSYAVMICAVKCVEECL
jgi:hypothetical protein